MSQEDYSTLLNAAVDQATDELAAHSEFGPFALAMQATDGEVFHLEPDATEEELDAEDVVGALRKDLRETAASGRWRAVAVVADVTLEDDDGELITAAIHISMEHSGGDPVTCIVPYAIDGEAVTLDDLITEDGERIVFANHQEN